MSRQCLAAGLLLLAGAFTPVSAQTPPSTRPISLIVQFPPGGGTDNIARLVAPGFSAALGQPVIVENRPGAGGNIGTDVVVRAKPDGHTLLMGNVSPIVINPHTYSPMSTTPMDLVPIGMVSQGPLVFVINAALPPKTLPEFIAYVKANPGKVNYASTGSGGITHIATELLIAKTGMQMTHVPYKGTAQAVQDLLGGHVQAMSDGLGSTVQLIKAGKVRALVISSMQRSPALPDVPIAAELGIDGFTFYGWLGMFAPPGTSADKVRSLKAALDKTLADPKVQEVILGNGAEIGGKASTEDFVRQVKGDYERWGTVVRTANIKAE